MCDFFDNLDWEDFAFWAGYIETQIEGEQEKKYDNEPLSPEEMLKTGNEIFDNDEE